MLHKKGRIFFKIFFSYISILLISIVIFTIVYNICLSTIKENSYSQFNTSLSQTIVVMDSKFDELETICDYIQSETSLQNLINSAKYFEEDFNPFDIYEASHNIFSYTEVNDTIKSVNIFIDIQGEQYAISNAVATTLNDKYIYDLNSILIKDEENLETIFNQKNVDNYSLLNTSDDENIFLISSIISDIDGSLLGAVTINIKNSLFDETLMSNESSETRFSYILDENMELIYSNKTEDFALSDEEIFYAEWVNGNSIPNGYTFYSQQSENNNWNYCIIISNETIYGQALSIQGVIIFINIILLIVGVAISFIFSRNNSAVFRKILNYLSEIETFDKNNETYDYIERSVSSLVNMHNDMMTNIRIQQPLLEAASLRNLLLENWAELDSEYTLNKFDIELKSKSIVAISKYRKFNNPLLETFTKNEFVFSQIKKSILSTINEKAYILDLDREQFAIVFFIENYTADITEKNINVALSNVSRELPQDETSQILFFVSDCCHSAKCIHAAYLQALNLSKKSVLKPEKFVYTSSSISNESFYEYSLETELKLSSYAKNGDLENVKKILTNIYIENFVNQPHSSDILNQLVNAMKVTLLRNKATFSFNENINVKYAILADAVSTNDVFNAVVDVYTSICENYSDKKMSKENEIVVNIINFMKENFSNDIFSIHETCENFNISESQIYKLFKDSFGKSFSETLESIRIENACELLKETNMPIKEISIRSGYNNDGSFRRAFKRCVGVSPSEYSKNIRI